jgi:hypothetical protein
MFTFTVDGQQADFGTVFPDFGERDRLGIVSRSPGGALGASGLILAAITAFYDRERAKGADFFRYPDYYLFHTADSVGPYGMIDIWPDHKEITVPAGKPEQLLRAINDRAITHLLIEDTAPGTPAFERATLASVGIRAALAYAPNGQVRGADMQVVGNAVSAGYVTAVLKAFPALPEATRAELQTRHTATPLIEQYRRVDNAEALALLAAV